MPATRQLSDSLPPLNPTATQQLPEEPDIGQTPSEIERLRKRIDALTRKLSYVKSEKENAEQQKDLLHQEAQRLKKRNEELEANFDELKSHLAEVVRASGEIVDRSKPPASSKSTKIPWRARRQSTDPPLDQQAVDAFADKVRQANETLRDDNLSLRSQLTSALAGLETATERAASLRLKNQDLAHARDCWSQRYRDADNRIDELEFLAHKQDPRLSTALWHTGIWDEAEFRRCLRSRDEFADQYFRAARHKVEVVLDQERRMYVDRKRTDRGYMEWGPLGSGGWRPGITYRPVGREREKERKRERMKGVGKDRKRAHTGLTVQEDGNASDGGPAGSSNSDTEDLARN